jgi:two-component system, chemotaxis family, response regulator WspF
VKIGIISERPIEAHTLHCAVSLESTNRVVWLAETAADAVPLCAAERPDLILLALPLEAGASAELVRGIRSVSRCPILLMVDGNRLNAPMVLEAIASGASDVHELPAPGHTSRRHAAALLAKIATISRHGWHQLAARRDEPVAASAPANGPLLVAIGASAGGPAAVATLLRGLPSAFPAGIVIVQHVDAGFVPGMARWFSEQSGHVVEVAQAGDRPAPGRVLLAGATGHLEIRNGGRLFYTSEPRASAYRPSVDVFFQSAGRAWPGSIIGVLLTGMGRDGARGLKALRERGHHTIAQDKASSVVYGMPKAAAALNAAVDIRPLQTIAPRLIDLASAGCVPVLGPSQEPGR